MCTSGSEYICDIHTLPFPFFLYRSAGFQSFVKMALIKNPRKRPSAETLLQVGLLILAFHQWIAVTYPSVSMRTPEIQ